LVVLQAPNKLKAMIKPIRPKRCKRGHVVTLWVMGDGQASGREASAWSMVI
jgi:hypothetical protein